MKRFLTTSLAPVVLTAWCGIAAVAAAPPAGKPAKPGAGRVPAKPADGPKVPQPAVPGPQDAATEFFETSVRPVLAEKCYSCHGSKIQQAGLRVDSLAALLKGNDAGKPALVVGKPEESLLVQVLSHTGPVKMPPQGKLSDKEIQALTEWVRMGAPWPGGSAAQKTAAQSSKPHWAFQPVRKPAVPRVKAAAWVKNPIDAFVLAKLESKGIRPSPAADRRTLIRRAYSDLTGLPPTADEVAAFVTDRSPDAWEKVVDRLLASPRYGERWGRYWLDVARYADTKGYVFQEERRYPFSFTYRDWVVRSLNEDLPYDQFLIQQIAADHLPLGDDKRALAAMGFLTLGRRFLNNQADIIDDRLDVVFRGTQGLTVACARCHDHKFDPIPTKDYYSLYGVFASSTEPRDLPVIGMPEQNASFLAYQKKLDELQGAVQAYLDGRRQKLRTEGMEKIADALLAVRDARGEERATAIAESYKITPGLLRKWQTFLADTAKNHHPIFAPWHALAALPDAEFAAKAPSLVAQFSANTDPVKKIHPRVAEALAGPAPATLREVAERYKKVLTSPGNDQQLEHALDSIGGPLNIEGDEIRRLLDRAERNQLQALQQKVDAFRATSKDAPPQAMVLVDLPRPVTPRVFRRGNPRNPGEEVPRQFLAVLSGPDRKPFQKGSGRLELAQAIASPENPLTARVMVNRIWLGHFGAGLVRTPSDFGTRSDPPANPELLDYLASWFVEEGWSMKKLHRLVMLSSTYRQSSNPNPRSAKVDPENTLFWRMNRRRLDFEAMRDSLLFAAGRLEEKLGGPPVDLFKQPFTTRRTLYGFIDRQNLPGTLRVFDFASPDSHSPQRYVTTVPQQALFLMNSPFIVEQARSLAQRTEAAASGAEERIQQLYRIAYGRSAMPDELALGLQFLAQELPDSSSTQGTPLWSYGYGEVDETSGRVKRFTALPHFQDGAWRGGPSLPDPAAGWAMLNATGGHAGNDLQHAAIRRWTAPRDGTFALSGNLRHPASEGDGVRARVVSSRDGVLGTWTAHNGAAETSLERVVLKKGDTLDFVVDCRGSVNHDGFIWAPTLRSLEPVAGGPAEWSAGAGFQGPASRGNGPLNAWEKYAQVLLMSNEFAFVD